MHFLSLGSFKHADMGCIYKILSLGNALLYFIFILVNGSKFQFKIQNILDDTYMLKQMQIFCIW